MHNDDHAADRRWHDLVLGLRADLDGIVEDFLSAVGLLEPYSRGQVPLAVLRHDAVSSFTHLIDELASRPRADHVTIAHDVGTDRARRGVPLPALMSAIRIDVEVLWTRIRGAMRTEDMPLVLDRVERLWEVVERYNRDVQQAYLEEQTLMTREREDEVGTVLTRLLDGPVTPALVGRFAGLLGVPEDGPLLVAAVPTTRRRGLWTWFRELIAERRPVHWQTRGDDALLVTSLTADQARDLRRGIVPARVSSVPCAVGPLADGVEDLPRSARLALRLARVLPVGSEDARRIRDLWLPLARADLDEDALTALVDAVTAPLTALPHADRTRLVSTLRSYLACGSVSETAAASYCHRNTVLNRLGQVRDLTGCDPSIPEQAALLLVCLAARPGETGAM